MLTIFVSALRAQSATAFHVPSSSPHHLLSRSLMATTASCSTPYKVNPNVVNLLQHQVTNEMTASQFYLSASVWCKRQDFDGMAAYMKRESDEERSHAIGILEFGLKRNLPLVLESLDAPPVEWDSVKHVWEAALVAEEENTKKLFALATAAQENQDHALTAFLMPFHLEQVESEDSLRRILAEVADENKTPGLLRQLDTKLGEEAL